MRQNGFDVVVLDEAGWLYELIFLTSVGRTG